MFNKICLLSIFLILIIGCNFTDEVKEDTTVPETPLDESRQIQTGDLVIARWKNNAFYEGKVKSIDGGNAKIEWIDGSEPLDVSMPDIYALPDKNTEHDVAVDDVVLAKFSSSTSWDPGNFVKMENEKYVVRQIGYEKTTTFDASKILKISKAAALDFEEQVVDSNFSDKAHSKNPTIPSDYKPKNGDEVLALWSANSWWSGKIKEVKNDKITVAWEDGSTPSDVAKDKVLPLPNSKSAEMPTENQYILAKPKSGTKWFYAQTVKVNGDEITVRDGAGKHSVLKLVEAVPLN